MGKTIVICALAGALAAAGQAEARSLRVVATVPALAALAKEVGGAQAEVVALTRGTQDPHFADARPNLALTLNRADLLLVVGLDLEVGWLPTLLGGARNPGILPGTRGHLDTSRFVELRDVHTGPVDRSQGDIHPGGNPHFLIDPRAAANVARGIAARMAELAPAHRGTFQATLEKLLGRLTIARRRWEERLAPCRGARVIGYHRTWVYLAAWLGLEEVGFLEPKPGIPPNPSHIAQLLALARQRGVRAILQEEYYPDSTSRLVARRIPAALVRVPGGPDLTRRQSYPAYLEAVVEALGRGLACEGRR